MLQSKGSQRVEHNWVTEQQQSRKLTIVDHIYPGRFGLFELKKKKSQFEKAVFYFIAKIQLGQLNNSSAFHCSLHW